MRSFATLAAIAAIPSLALAVQIADFTPRVYNLPAACYTLYNQTSIPGCQSSDFQGGHGCSNLCIVGLSSMVGPIQLACGNANVASNTPLYAFLSGTAVHDFCPNAPAPTTTQQPTTQAAPSTTSTQQTTTTQQQPTTTDTPTTTSSTTSTSATPVVYSSSSTVSSTASSTSSTASSGSSAQSTSSSSSSSVTSALSSDSSSTTQAAAASTSRPTNNSGGGSPFDVSSSNDATLSNGSGYTWALFLSALLAGYAL